MGRNESIQLERNDKSMLLTSYFGLKKPEGTDTVNIADFNYNADIIDAQLNSLGVNKAPLASPVFTGVPAAPTAAANTNTTQVATTAFVLGQVGTAAPLVNGTAAVGTSLLYARQDHVHGTDATRAPLASPTFTGTPAAPTATAGTNTTQLATTAFVSGAIATAVAGNSATSSKWATARTISLTGGVTGSVSVDGSANVSMAATVGNDSHAHSIGYISGLQSALDAKSIKSAVSIDVSVDILTLAPGHYMSEGVISTAQNYPASYAFQHFTIVVEGYSNTDQTGYRVVRVTNHGGESWYNMQGWYTGQWTGWQKVAFTGTTSLPLANGWAAQMGNSVMRTGNTVTVNAVLQSGTMTSGTVFAVLPYGYRPSIQRYFICQIANASWVVTNVGVIVDPGGNIFFDGACSGNTRLMVNITFTI